MGETVFVRSKQWFKNLNHLTEMVQSLCFISLSLMGAFLKVYRWLLHGDIGQFEFRSLTTDSNGAKFHWHSHNITLSLPCSHIYSRWTKSLMKTQKDIFISSLVLRFWHVSLDVTSENPWTFLFLKRNRVSVDEVWSATSLLCPLPCPGDGCWGRVQCLSCWACRGVRDM